MTRTDPTFVDPSGDGSPGERLRRAREAANLGVTDIATSLRLEPKTIELLETDSFDRLPAPTFVRGYLRGYARTVGLKPEPLLDLYERHGFAPPPLIPESVETSRSLSSLVFRLATFAIGAGLLVLVVLWWRSQDLGDLGIDGDLIGWGSDAEGDPALPDLRPSPGPADASEEADVSAAVADDPLTQTQDTASSSRPETAPGEPDAALADSPPAESADSGTIPGSSAAQAATGTEGPADAVGETDPTSDSDPAAEPESAPRTDAEPTASAESVVVSEAAPAAVVESGSAAETDPASASGPAIVTAIGLQADPTSEPIPAPEEEPAADTTTESESTAEPESAAESQPADGADRPSDEDRPGAEPDSVEGSAAAPETESDRAGRPDAPEGEPAEGAESADVTAGAASAAEAPAQDADASLAESGQDGSGDDRAAPAAAQAAPSELALEFVHESWVEVYDHERTRLFFGLVSPGRTLRFTAMAPFDILLGYALDARIRLNGEVFDHSPYIKHGVARFTLEPTASRSAEVPVPEETGSPEYVTPSPFAIESR